MKAINQPRIIWVLLLLVINGCADGVDKNNGNDSEELDPLKNEHSVSFKAYWLDDQLIFSRSQKFNELSSITFFKDVNILWRLNFRHNEFEALAYGEIPVVLRPAPGSGQPRQTDPPNNEAPPILNEGDEIIVVLTSIQDVLVDRDHVAPAHGHESWLIVIPKMGESAFGVSVDWP